MADEAVTVSAPAGATPEIPAPTEPTPPANQTDTAPAPTEAAATTETPAAAPAPETPPLLDGPAVEIPAEPAAPAAPAEPEPPTAYEPFTFPETLQVAHDDPALVKFTELVGSHHLPQEAAQGLLDLYHEAGTQLRNALVQRQFDVFADTVKAWDAESKKVFGNRYQATIDDAKWGMARLAGTPAQQAELRQALLNSGLGSHPAIIRAFANATALREAGPPPPRLGQGTSRPNAADRRYGNSPGMGNGAQR